MSPPHVVCAALLWSGAVLAAPADRPCVTLSRTSRAPTIDGRIEPEEWAEAAALGGLLSLEETSVAQPGSLVYLTFDDRAVYLAARCEEPDPTRPRGFVRAHDDRAFEDDAVQLYLAPEDLRQAKTTSIAFGGYEGAYDTWYDDLAAHYEFTVNCRGSITEARNDVRDWDAPWSAKVSREAGGWSAEMAVPSPRSG